MVCIFIKHFAATGLLLLAAGAASAAELAVIVSARSPVTALTVGQAADIFLGQSGRFPDGSEAKPLDLSLGSPLRDEFYLKVAARSPALMKAWWTKMVFTGRGQPPREAASGAAMRKLVADNPGLVGYIDKSDLDASVRAVLLVK